MVSLNPFKKRDITTSDAATQKLVTDNDNTRFGEKCIETASPEEIIRMGGYPTKDLSTTYTTERQLNIIRHRMKQAYLNKLMQVEDMEPYDASIEEMAYTQNYIQIVAARGLQGWFLSKFSRMQLSGVQQVEQIHKERK